MNEFWIFKIASVNFIVLLVLLLHTFSIFFKFKKLFVISLLALLFFQYKTTTPQSLTLLDNDEQRIHQIRLKEYNPSNHYLRVIFFRLDLKFFLEGSFSTALDRLQRNFFEGIDLNVYFFGGHPRQRVWASDFEKLPYFLVIPFLVGLYQTLIRKKYLILISASSAIALLTVIGHKNEMGPFVLLPSILVIIYFGTIDVWQFLKSIR